MTAEKYKGPFWGHRHTQTLLLFLAVLANYITKYNTSIAVVAMTNAESTNPNFDEYDWTLQQQSYILSSFFWGYVITNIPGGVVARRFGTKRTLLVATFGSSVFGVLTPFLVPWGGWQVYCGIRMLQGFFQGPLFPCLHAHLAAWCPLKERNRLGALANSGIECGTLLAMYLPGVIAASSMGWPGISYVACGVGVAWCLVWLFFGSNSPGQSKSITEAERDYILNSKAPITEATEKGSKPTPPRMIPVPWKAMMMSLPFWALVQVRAAQSWGFNTLQAEIPSYMNGVLNMDMSDNALFSALPYLAMWIMSYVFLIACDILMYRKILSLNALRKSVNSISYWIPAAMLIGIGFLGEKNKTMAIVLMTLAVGINAGCTIGSALNTIDLSPNHAGIVMSIVNTISNIVPIITPLVAGMIVQDEHDRTQWQIVFIIAAVIFIVGNLFFIIFGSTDRQPWDDEHFLLGNEIQNENGEVKSVEEMTTEVPKEVPTE